MHTESERRLKRLARLNKAAAYVDESRTTYWRHTKAGIWPEPLMPAALSRAESTLAEAREQLENLRQEAAALRAEYQRKPAPPLAESIRGYDERIAAVQDRIRAARRVRADLLPSHANEVTTAIEKPVADAARRLQKALPEIRAAHGIIQDAARLPGQTALAGALLVIDMRGLDRLETFAASLVGETSE